MHGALHAAYSSNCPLNTSPALSPFLTLPLSVCVCVCSCDLDHVSASALRSLIIVSKQERRRGVATTKRIGFFTFSFDFGRSSTSPRHTVIPSSLQSSIPHPPLSCSALIYTLWSFTIGQDQLRQQLPLHCLALQSPSEIRKFHFN